MYRSHILKNFLKGLIFLFFLGNSVHLFSQTDIIYYCTYGFTYEISQQESWGYHKPVILSVFPSSSAAQARLQPDDIIEEINGMSTREESIEEIDEWMHDINTDELSLTVFNLKGTRNNVKVVKKCTYNNIITEKDLASSHAFYSLEDIQKRSFVCPFRTITRPTVNLFSYKTFGFDQADENKKELENGINESIRKVLESKGLVYKNNNPDLIVQTYYSHKPNLNYKPRSNGGKTSVACRYNVHSKTMEYLPVYESSSTISSQAEYTLRLGIQLVDKLESTPDNLVVVWECEANEFTKTGYSLEDYAGFHIPLMMMQYPFAKTDGYAKFLFQRFKYNYTGINYNLDNLEYVFSVDAQSPAANGGIREGDWVKKINDIKTNGNPVDAEEKYKDFIYKTFNLRDSKTLFTNAYGFAWCAYWEKLKYAQIEEIFKEPDFQTTFAYLFYFEPFINLSGTNIVAFDIQREKQKIRVNIQPEIKYEETFETVR
jgi:hypothetical protein